MGLVASVRRALRWNANPHDWELHRLPHPDLWHCRRCGADEPETWADHERGRWPPPLFGCVALPIPSGAPSESANLPVVDDDHA